MFLTEEKKEEAEEKKEEKKRNVCLCCLSELDRIKLKEPHTVSTKWEKKKAPMSW